MRLFRQSTPLGQTLKQFTRPAADALTQKIDEGKVGCCACAHNCHIAPGAAGICKVRFNEDGVLHVPSGYVAGLALDPIEKKPFYHAFPGQDALSFGMLGCNFHCDFCQNWISSQALRDPEAVTAIQEITPEHLVEAAIEHGAPVITSTYNEPLITSEWAIEIMRLGARRGLAGGYVSNGHASPEVLRFIRPYVKLYKVDLKCFSDASYRRLGGRLSAVKDTLARLVEMDFWVEVVTLLVPGFNDSDEELRALCGFLAGLSRSIPWHVTAFHPMYKMTDPPPTTARQLLHAAEIGREAGLDFVYVGNLPGVVGEWENTRCPGCGSLLIERTGFHVRRNRLDAASGGRCPDCRREIPGVWGRFTGDSAPLPASLYNPSPEPSPES